MTSRRRTRSNCLAFVSTRKTDGDTTFKNIAQRDDSPLASARWLREAPSGSRRSQARTRLGPVQFVANRRPPAPAGTMKVREGRNAMARGGAGAARGRGRGHPGSQARNASTSNKAYPPPAPRAPALAAPRPLFTNVIFLSPLRNRRG